LFKSGGGVTRLIQPPEYQIIINPHQQPVTTYQFLAPGGCANKPVDAKALLLRFKISNSGIVSLIQKFTIHQEGNIQGVDLYQYIINNEGVGSVLEILLPWDKTLFENINV